MENAPRPKFERTTSASGYPVLERVKDLHEQVDYENMPEALPKNQRQKLHLTLALIGALGAGTAGKYAYDTYEPKSENEITTPDYSKVEPSPSISQEARESVEAELTDYEKRLAGLQAQFELKYDEVQVLNADGKPVGEPISINKNDFGLEPGYQGPVNSVGIATEGIAGQWLQYSRQQVQQEHPDEVIAGQLHASTTFQSLYGNERFPEITERIDNGQIETTADLVAYFIEQPFAHSAGLNRYEYALQRVEFRDEELVIPIEGGEVRRRAVPPAVQEVFKDILPGLIAHESMFRDDLVSSVGAKGAAQIIPDEWARVNRDAPYSTEFAEQIDAWGKIMSDFYNSIHERVGDEALQVLRTQFDSEEEFQTELMSRLTLLSYNAGPKRVGEVVRAYVHSVQADDIPSGADVYLAIVQFGELASDEMYGGELLDGFGSEASSYVLQAEAKAHVLNERYKGSGNTQIASSY